MKRSLVSFLLPLAASVLLGQTPPRLETGLPFIQNYPPQTTGGLAQNWQMVQDRRGLIYAANFSGVLQYDGQSWRIIPTPNHNAVRTLAIGLDGAVYFGANSDFGYLAADSTGKLKAVSLLSRLKPADRGFYRIQHILAIPSGMYFLSGETLFRWSGQRMRVWRGLKPFRRAFAVQDELYILQKDVGLLHLDGDSLRLLPQGDRLASHLVRGIAASPGGTNRPSRQAQQALLIATHTHGLFLHDGAMLRPFQTEVDALLKESRIHHLLRLPDGSYAIATLKAGVIIIDAGGKFLFQIDARTGLLSNDVKSIYLDRDGDMWLALQTGVARVEYGSPLSFFNAQTGFIGSIGAIQRHLGTLYVATSQGVLFLTPSPRVRPQRQSAVSASRFVAVSGIKASCWALLSIDGSLLAATEDGIFQIDGDRASLIPAPGGEKLFALGLSPSTYDDSLIFVGLRDGMATLQRIGGQWVNQGRKLTTRHRIYNFIQLSANDLWLETRSDVILRVALPGGDFQNLTVRQYDAAAGLPTGPELLFIRMDSDLFALSPTQMFRFDEAQDRLVPDTTFGPPIREGFSYYSFITNGERGRVWTERGSRSMRVAFREPAGGYRWLSEPFVKTPNGLIWSVYGEADGTVWFGGDDILYRYAPPARPIPRMSFPALIRRVATLNSDSTIFGGASLDEEPEAPALAYRDNALRFECAAPSYATPEANQFQYFLQGFDRGWSRWSTEAKRDYTNLPEGRYVFRVRARNVYGQESREAIYAFTILPPWYRSWWAFGLYILLTGAILYSIRRYELNRLRLKDQLKMKRFEAEKLKELDQMRSDFFANISHEFRTPLTLILGQIENLWEEIGDPRQTKKLAIAARHARRLKELINQLLDVAKLEAGKMPYRAQMTNIVPFLRKWFASFESLARQKRLGMRFYAERENIEVYFEAEKLEKIFINLVSNAIKFTPTGGEVSASVRVPETDGKADWVEIEVRDSGIGIPEDRLPHIFDRFYQVESGSTRDYEGTGIGLALVKELVELHSGEIAVTSKVGMGTVFRVRLPLGSGHLMESQILPPAPLEEPFPRRRSRSSAASEATTKRRPKSTGAPIILIIEDNPDMRQYIRETLEASYTIVESVDGADGLEKAKERVPDLIISDVMMPKIDGYELARRLRAHELTSHIPIVMLTAKAAEEEKLEGLETGVDAYLTKPFSTRELQVRVRKLIEMRQKLLQQRKPPLRVISSEVAVTPVDGRFLERLQEVVEAHMEEETFQVKELCRKIGIGERQLYRKLQALLGCTPAAYIRQIRLDRARQLLEKGAGTVSEITFMVGYGNTSAFARAFREAFGKAPSQLLKEAKKR